MRKLFTILSLIVALTGSSLLASDLSMMGITSSGDDDYVSLEPARIRKIIIVDNTFMGISGLKDLRDRFSEAGWDAEYHEDTFVGELIGYAKEADVLYIVTHAGVRQSTQEIGFVWRSLFGIRKNVLVSGEIKEMMAGERGPELVVVAGCKVAFNETMADAFGSSLIGFQTDINPITAASFCRQVLDKIAAGQSYEQAFSGTPARSSFLNSNGGRPRFIQRSAGQAVD